MYSVIDLRGLTAPADRGDAFGRAAVAPLARSVEFYRWLLPAMLQRPWEGIVAAATDLMDLAAGRTPDGVAFVRAAAEHSAQRYEDVAAVCCRSELMALAGAAANECTALRHGRGLAQTWDWFVAQRDACVVIRTDRSLTFTEAGMPAKIGLNADGLAISLNFLSTSPPPERPGVPIHLVIADLLERVDSVGAALDHLHTVPIACSATIGLADSTGAAAFVELTPYRSPEILMDLPVHTNHCLAHALVGRDQPGLLLDSSHRRLARARELVVAGAPPETILADTVDPVSAIDVAPIPDGARHALGTVAGVIMDVFEREMLLAPSRPSTGGFVQRVGLDAGS